MIKSARKYVESDLEVKVKEINFNSNKMSNRILWTILNPSNEKIKRIDLLIYSNDSSVEKGTIEQTKILGPNSRNYIHHLTIVSKNNFKIYAYQIIVHTNKTTKSSQVERFSVRDIYECPPPKQITFKVEATKISFNILCTPSKFNTNIFVFRKDFDDDTFERIAVLSHRNQIFVDRNVTLGHFYEYRFISYDLFGYFSQKIIKIKIFVWTKELHTPKNKILLDPVPIAELGAGVTENNPKIKLKISNIDSMCKFYDVKRRDISEKNISFKEVEQWEGNNRLYNDNSKEELVFYDSIIRNNSNYEYCVFGYDIFGNKTDTRVSNIINVGSSFTPAIPINVSASIIEEYPTGVKISWIDDNLNQTIGDIISGSSDLFPKQNLYYFKVFRRRYDQLNYESYPEQTSSFFIDMCDDDGIWKTKDDVYYQPSTPIRDNKYYYFIKTYDQNGIESNRSSEIFADLSVYPKQIKDLKILYNDVIKPSRCTLVWETQENDKTLDSFMVERMEKDKGLWEKIGRSYFTTKYIDNTIQQDKRYIYRLKAEDFEGNQSQYVYAIFETIDD